MSQQSPWQFPKAYTDVHAFRKIQLAWLTRPWLVWIAFSATGLAFASIPDTQSAASLLAKYASLGERLQYNPFGRTLALDSSESSSALRGDIYALVNYPFPTVSAALQDAENWCDVLILHINTKQCRARTGKANTVLRVSIGKKTAQPIEDAYRIQFQAVPVGNGRTFLHLTYSYDYGLAGRLAMKTYLATIGSGKVGFTIIGKLPSGQPKYIGGMRGVAERNTMRYYLAIDAYLGALTAPPRLQFQKSLLRWFIATEQYPRQLHEVNQTAYIDMKRREYLRQQATQ